MTLFVFTIYNGGDCIQTLSTTDARNASRYYNHFRLFHDLQVVQTAGPVWVYRINL